MASNVTDLKLYFFLGETMKHEKEREREGEITDTADTSKHSKNTNQGKQHRGSAEELDMFWDITVRMLLKSHFSAVLPDHKNKKNELKSNRKD